MIKYLNRQASKNLQGFELFFHMHEQAILLCAAHTFCLVVELCLAV